MTKLTVCLLLGLAGGAATLTAAVDLSKLPPPINKPNVTFDQDIRPLFEASCVRCHGADRPKGGIRLDTREATLAGGEHGEILIPGDSGKGALVISISQLNEKNAMPPMHKEGHGGGHKGRPSKPQTTNRLPPPPPAKPLTPDQVGLVRAWINQGAK